MWRTTTAILIALAMYFIVIDDNRCTPILLLAIWLEIRVYSVNRTPPRRR